MYIVFNIETVQDPSAPAITSLSVAGMKAPGGWKDPVKIQAHKEQAYLDALSDTGLKPLTGKIVCITYQLANRTSNTIQPMMTTLLNPLTEHQILEGLSAICMAWPDGILVTYNGRLFDIPYTVSRMMAHSIQLPELLRCASRSKSTVYHIDLFEIFGKQGKLREWALRYELDPILGSGSQVQDWWDNNEFANIEHHCEDNVRVTMELLKRYVG